MLTKINLPHAVHAAAINATIYDLKLAIAQDYVNNPAASSMLSFAVEVLEKRLTKALESLNYSAV